MMLQTPENGIKTKEVKESMVLFYFNSIFHEAKLVYSLKQLLCFVLFM